MALVASACRNEAQPGEARASKESGRPAVAKAPLPPSAPKIPERDARALLDAWLTAQQAGDFARYEALYADRFEGVKRAGLRSERFDRQGWMRDRQKMFARPMHVEASEVAISTLA